MHTDAPRAGFAGSGNPVVLPRYSTADVRWQSCNSPVLHAESFTVTNDPENILIEIDVPTRIGCCYCTVELHIPRKTNSLLVPSEAMIFNRDDLQLASSNTAS